MSLTVPHRLRIILLWLSLLALAPGDVLAQSSRATSDTSDDANVQPAPSTQAPASVKPSAAEASKEGSEKNKKVDTTPGDKKKEEDDTPRVKTPKGTVPDKKATELTREEENSLFELDERNTLGSDNKGLGRSIERAREKDIAMMTDSELLDAGFVFGDRDRDSRVRSTATLLALTAGSAFHGVGHWYMGDRNTGVALAFMEAAGVIIAGVAGLLPMVYGQEFGVSSYSRHLLYFGAGLFGASYVLDVIGTAQGSEQLSFKNSNRIKGAAATARYGYLELNDLPIRNVLRGGLELDVGGVYLLGRTIQDVGLQLSGYGGTLGGRIWRSSRWPQSTVYVEADTFWLMFRGLARFEQLDVVGQAGVSLDLGMFSTHLSQIVIGGHTGYLYQWYAFPNTTQYSPLREEQAPEGWSYGIGGIPFEMYVHFNLSERMHARFAYTKRDGGLLQGTDDYLAVPSLQINYRSTQKLDIELKFEYGAGVGLWGGFKYWMWQGEPIRRRNRAKSSTE